MIGPIRVASLVLLLSFATSSLSAPAVPIVGAFIGGTEDCE